MKIKLALLAGAGLAISAVAAEWHHAEIQTSKESPQSVVVVSDKEPVAVIKLVKPGLIHLQGQDISITMHPGGKKRYISKNGSSLDLTVDGKSLLKVSGDSMTIEEQKAD
jgi:hypothetical protein